MASNFHELMFNKLKQSTHSVGENAFLPLFGDTQNINNSEYWLFSDLYNIFNGAYVGNHQSIYATVQENISFPEFKKLTNNKKTPQSEQISFAQFCDSHCIQITNNYAIKNPSGTIAKKNGPDAKLSRYACWKIISPWPATLFAQLYFLIPHASFTDLYTTAYKYSRIYQRNELARANKIVNGIANRNHADMRQFNNLLHRAFFYSSDINSIKENYDISGKIYDHMGARSLTYRKNAMYRAIKQLDENSKIKFARFTDILYAELVNARIRMIQQTGIAPEHDISRRPIAQIASEFKKLQQQFVKQYAFQTLR